MSPSTNELKSFAPSVPVCLWVAMNSARETRTTYAHSSAALGKSHQSPCSSPKSKKTCAWLPPQSLSSAPLFDRTFSGGLVPVFAYSVTSRQNLPRKIVADRRTRLVLSVGSTRGWARPIIQKPTGCPRITANSQSLNRLNMNKDCRLRVLEFGNARCIGAIFSHNRVQMAALCSEIRFETICLATDG